MDVNSLTIGQAREIAALFAGTAGAGSAACPGNRPIGPAIGTMVVVRTYSAGVHFGQFAGRDGREVVLNNSRRIWQWRGANTLNEIALRGIDVKNSRVSEPVASVTLLEAIEIIPMELAAINCLAGAAWQS